MSLFEVVFFGSIAAVFALVSYLRWRRRTKRQRRVVLAAAEASLDDAAFDPTAVRDRAAALFKGVQHARSRGNLALLSKLVTPELLAEERRRLDDFARRGLLHEITVIDTSPVEYLGLVNRAGEREDRVTVRITAQVYDDQYRASDGRQLFLSRDQEEDEDTSAWVTEYWTLAKCVDGRGWIVAAIESDVEGKHTLDAAIITSPSGDLQRMTDASVLEVAALDKLPDEVRPSEVFDLDYAGDAYKAVLDLSAVDGRWAPFVLEAAVRRAVEAWAAAVDGADGGLLAVATPEAAHALLHPDDPWRDTRLVIRAPQVQFLAITELNPDADPPRMTLELDVRGRRYVEDRQTGALLTGSKRFASTTTMRWTLALSGPDEHPWQIVDTVTSVSRMRALIERIQRVTAPE